MKRSQYADSFFQLVKEDCRSVRIKTPLHWMLALIIRPDILTLFLHRAASCLYKKGLAGRVLSKIFWRINVFQSACFIDQAAEIGGGMVMPHPTGIIIGPAKIGTNFKIYQNATVGRHRNKSDDYRRDETPLTIGHDVTIFSGAVVSGNVAIGNNVIIGANAVVLSNIPDDCTAVGAPARIIRRADKNNAS